MINTDYSYLITPFLAWLIAGSIKFLINSIKSRTPAFGLIGYGGMPSNHTAIVVSMATLIGLKSSVDSAAFGVAITLAFIVILDALSLRRQIGKQATQINRILDSMGDKAVLRERVGHSIGEIVGGILVGASVAILVNWL